MARIHPFLFLIISLPCQGKSFGSFWPKYSIVKGRSSDAMIEVSVVGRSSNSGTRFQNRVEAYVDGEKKLREEALEAMLKVIDEKGYAPCDDRFDFMICVSDIISNATIERREWCKDDSYVLVAMMDMTPLDRVVKRKK